ncbi:MAG: transcriptional regulator [Candidatus Harrisonbacteria bacterium CG10_big_fil_rev_8_21_14_0_10_49_15]|uniref:Transcriptional regulator n=1 Tax=Candidatus Harrisonbacteria bacterium CG10_big_fil_rev_8_21_14_0_10_49_15 TaxID=1974587 RepID=A0A2H0ULM6_9BACT|nr:MAG: transcriptional regulator [Candidatus Harrisonbacteria bacterium CG10_big_fil_rev_8_21_14_0_10_49_15]
MAAEEVVNNVYGLRQASGITQEALGGAVGVSRQTVIAIEKGNYIPSVLLAIKIAKFFKRPLEEVFYIKKS